MKHCMNTQTNEYQRRPELELGTPLAGIGSTS
jgi:hypothetical protein